MWVPLATYREVIFKLAKRHQWSQVARYDRRFRQEAAGKDDVRWEEENLSRQVKHSGPRLPAIKGAGKPGGWAQARARARTCACAGAVIRRKDLV